MGFNKCWGIIMISIIVPVYNCISSLEKCIDSIQNQTWTDWELLLIDDGSTDGSEQLCDIFASKDARIHVLHKPNGGVSSARNMGLDHAKGEYVMFCDSDDWVEPEWCEQLYLAAKQNSGCQPICNYYRSTADCESINREGQCENMGKSIAKADFFSLNRYELLGIPWNKIYLRSLLEDNHIRFQTELSLGEDLIFNLDYLHCLTDGFVFINRPLYHYSVGSTDSLSSKYYPDLVEIYRKVYMRIKDELCSIPEAYEKWKLEYEHSYFFALDRVFRNTWSKKNSATVHQKWKYNQTVFHSEAFQNCRKTIPKDYINVLQYWGLQTNSFLIYWATVILSETISYYIHKNNS